MNILECSKYLHPWYICVEIFDGRMSLLHAGCDAGFDASELSFPSSLQHMMQFPRQAVLHGCPGHRSCGVGGRMILLNWAK
jgi:hypothetical protein